MQTLNEQSLSVIVDRISTKLGSSAKDLLAVYEKQLKVQLTQYYIGMFVGFILVLISYVGFRHYYANWLLPDAPPLPQIVQLKTLASSVVFPMVLLLYIGYVFSAINDLIVMKLNPEYWVYNRLFSSFKN